MPIKKENKHRYLPRKVWLKLRLIILERANHCCEMCGVKNYSLRNGSRIVLSVAHLDQQPENNNPENLKALCQRCHLNHDRPFHIKKRRITMFIKARKKTGNFDLFGF